MSTQLGRALLQRKLPGRSPRGLQPPGPHRRTVVPWWGCVSARARACVCVPWDFIALACAQAATGCRGRSRDLGVRLGPGPCQTLTGHKYCRRATSSLPGRWTPVPPDTAQHLFVLFFGDICQSLHSGICQARVLDEQQQSPGSSSLGCGLAGWP